MPTRKRTTIRATPPTTPPAIEPAFKLDEDGDELFEEFGSEGGGLPGVVFISGFVPEEAASAKRFSTSLLDHTTDASPP